MSIRIPLTPPNILDITTKIPPNRLVELLTLRHISSPTSKYLHWDRLCHITPPEGLSSDEWWLTTKLARHQSLKPLPLVDKSGRPFQFLVTSEVNEALFKFDRNATGHDGMPDVIVNPQTRNQYYVSSLIEEAITSSQLEGATTTRVVAKEMIRENREPRDRSEQMILNNYATMREIGKIKNDRLSKDLVFHIHRTMTSGTLDIPDASGRFRRTDEDIVVEDSEGKVYHVPPMTSELDRRMEAMCAFANADMPDYFIHPVVRSIILHFWLAYDHPFVDGNGRTARALFYWSMLRYGYWASEYISISHVIRLAKIEYSKAFLYTETDDNDLTYFIVYHVELLQKAFKALDEYIQKKAADLTSVDNHLNLQIALNRRQRALISHALRHPSFFYSARGHMSIHGIAFNTAKADLEGLVEHSLLEVRRGSRPQYYSVPKDLKARIANASANV